jgi:hypothetical protein
MSAAISGVDLPNPITQLKVEVNDILPSMMHLAWEE